MLMIVIILMMMLLMMLLRLMMMIIIVVIIHPCSPFTPFMLTLFCSSSSRSSSPQRGAEKAIPA